MKNYSLITLVLLVTGIMLTAGCKSSKSVAETPKMEAGEEKINPLEGMPRFLEGNVQEWIARHVVYPKRALKDKVQGKVYVSFWINKNGRVTSPEVIRSSGNAYLDAEAVRVVRSMPAWSAPRVKGKRVKLPMTLPINFYLQLKGN